jgi:hypothetical protein
MPARTGVEGLESDLAKDREVMAGRPHLVYERLDGLVAAAVPRGLGERLATAWSGRGFNAWYDRPRLILASLRFDALREGPAHPLWRAIAAPAPEPAAATAEALEAATAPRRTRFWDAVARRHVQTNETSRAVAWLWPARLAGAGADRPLALADLGASAGLNLVADALPAPWVDAGGAPLAVASAPRVAARLGLDANPLDALDGDDADWLRACIWPGEAARIARLEAALAAFAASARGPDRPRVKAARARDMPARVAALSAAHADALTLAYQTTFRDYLASDERREFEAAMRAWLLSRPAGSALWVEVEHAKDGTPERPSAIVAHLRDGDRVRDVLLGRCGYHPTTIWVEPGAESALATRG